jgi:hypothetical protein
MRMEFRPGVSAASPAPQNPQNRFQHATVLNPRTAALALLGWLGEQGRNLLPLRFGQQRTRSGHSPSFGAANSAYLSSQKTPVPSFQGPVLRYGTASTTFFFGKLRGGEVESNVNSFLWSQSLKTSGLGVVQSAGHLKAAHNAARQRHHT